MPLKAGFMKTCEWPFRKSLNRTDILELLQTERSNSIVPLVLFYALDPKILQMTNIVWKSHKKRGLVSKRMFGAP